MTYRGPGERALPMLLVAMPAVSQQWALDELRDPRFTYHLASTGREALRDLYRYRPDLLVLGMYLRDPGPWDVLRRVREMTEDLRVMVIDRDYREAVAVRALASGADDYLWATMSRPFGKAQVLARLRRARPVAPAAQLIEDGRLSLDVVTHEASVAGTFLPLTPLEFDVLEILARNPGQVLTPVQLLDRVWKNPAEGSPAKVRYVVLRLRRAFEKATGSPAPIETVRGVGYRYRPPQQQ
ncbi:response regulator transcription factor [Streptomyces sp. NPDC052225]|uniref:response regulator transcription factor n=1 Tax=Streptomyces sp. NPDC052225 TaxID=3154949 RepID=UPI003413AD4E